MLLPHPQSIDDVEAAISNCSVVAAVDKTTSGAAEYSFIGRRTYERTQKSDSGAGGSAPARCHGIDGASAVRPACVSSGFSPTPRSCTRWLSSLVPVAVTITQHRERTYQRRDAAQRASISASGFSFPAVIVTGPGNEIGDRCAAARARAT